MFGTPSVTASAALTGTAAGFAAAALNADTAKGVSWTRINMNINACGNCAYEDSNNIRNYYNETPPNMSAVYDVFQQRGHEFSNNPFAILNRRNNALQ